MMTAGRALIWLSLPVLAAALVLMDRQIAGLLSRDLWDMLGLPNAPIRALPFLLLIVLAATAAVIALRRVGDWQAISLVLLIGTSQLNGFGFGPLDAFDIALFGLFFVWLGTRALDIDREFRTPPLVWLAAALVIIAFAHMPLLNPVSWFLGMFGIVRVFLLTVLIIDLCRTPEKLDLALRVFLWVAVASAIVGIVQFALAYFNVFLFTLINPPSSAFKPTPIGFVMRASAFCITAQHFSSFLIYALPIALWRVSVLPSPGRIMTVAILLCGIIVSWNTGGMLAALAMLVLFPLLRWPALTLHIAILGLTALAAAYYAGLMELVYDLTFGDSGVAKGMDQRKTLMELGIEQIGLNPVMGSGLRGFGQVDGNYWTRPVHNVLFQALAELGIFGGLVLVSIFFVLTVETVRLYRVPSAKRHAVYCGLSLLGVTVLSQSEPNIDQSNLWLVLSLIQAAVVIHARADRMPIVPPPDSPEQSTRTVS
jgi:O-antigen ligase